MPWPIGHEASSQVAHSAHFLQRLDRVPRSLTDFALGLYRDEPRVKWILHYAHLPTEVERVALALDDGGDGPHIVVTREGKFVTALGAGMKPSHLTVLTRSQVDTFSARVDDARERFLLAKEVVAAGKRPEDMLNLLTWRPWGLSREEFAAIAAWVPLMHLRFFTEIFPSASTAMSFRETYLAIQTKAFRNGERTRDALLKHWNICHGIGVRYALAMMGELHWVEAFGARWDEEYGPTWHATDQHVLAVALRGAWAAARMGKPLLPTYKRILSTQRHPSVTLDALIALTAIGIRHTSLREPARRMIATALESSDPRLLTWTKQLVASSDLAFDDPEAALDAPLKYGQQLLVAKFRLLPEGSPYRYWKMEDVPRETAFTLVANETYDSFTPTAFHMLPWVAKLATPEELYCPDALARPFRVAPTPEMVAEVYERMNAGGGPKPITRGAPKTGRNDACPCGSGKKLKKCCAT